MASLLSKSNPKTLAFVAGSCFLFLYWLIGFDGITFSDDVYYLLAGKKFWEGTMEFNAYHFSTRWGAYVPAGLIGHVFGFEPHRISLISLLSYVGALGLLMKVLPEKVNPWILVVWFSTQVYFLHFLTKVYPDSLLVIWVVLVPFAAVFRNQKPFLAALGLISGLFFGFLTKETIVFLAPFPVILFLFDLKSRQLNVRFNSALFGLGIAAGLLYLGYFWYSFGDPFYRISSINSGHYISEFTYADKGFWAMLRRLTYLPILTFVERSYWIWLVLAISGVWKMTREKTSSQLEFSLAFILLFIGFWFMSSTLEFYNPIYLNPRHLIILVPILAFLIATGWVAGKTHQKIRRLQLALIFIGAAISLGQNDLRMAGFQAVFFLLLLPKKLPYRTASLAVILLIPALYSIFYQKQLKSYSTLVDTLNQTTSTTENQEVILVNNFIAFSKDVLLNGDHRAQSRLVGIDKIDSIQSLNPSRIQVIIYRYYQHAYPKEQVDVDALEKWLLNKKLVYEVKSDQVWIRRFEMDQNKRF
ncbi:MAG: hypothetical protein MUE75_17910 [Algoriphagus sp.]|nr:hypothetical protein [Algoriphagus sp.]